MSHEAIEAFGRGFARGLLEGKAPTERAAPSKAGKPPPDAEDAIRAIARQEFIKAIQETTDIAPAAEQLDMEFGRGIPPMDPGPPRDETQGAYVPTYDPNMPGSAGNWGSSAPHDPSVQ